MSQKKFSRTAKQSQRLYSEIKNNQVVFVVPFLVAVTTQTLLLLSVVRGWLGPAVGAGNFCCEAARDALIKQPANTWSNLGFTVVGLVSAWLLTKKKFQKNENELAQNKLFAIFFLCIVILLGSGSMAMHATETDIGGALDLFSMYMVSSFIVAYAMQRFFGWGLLQFCIALFLSVAFCELAGLYDQRIPIIEYAGDAAFGITILLGIAFEFLIGRFRNLRRENEWGIYALVAFAAAFISWTIGKNGNPLCEPNSLIQGHALWHLFGALALFFLFRFYVSERVRA